MICAGIVLFHPDLKRIEENINSIIDQVDLVVLVDNGSDNFEEVNKIYSNNEKILIHSLKKNMGIARALNIITKTAIDLKCEWVLTLDQDSICQEKLVECYMRYIDNPQIAMMSCKMKDRNYSLKHGDPVFDSEYIDIDQCITSGCFMRISAIERAGFFDEKMFIDYVDFDMCATLRELGYKIILCNYEGLLHELGKGEIRHFLWKEHLITNHSPIRRYYYSRNVIYYINKHKKYISVKKKWKELYGGIFYDIIVIILYESGKKSKLNSSFKGIKDGIIMSKMYSKDK